MFGGLPLALWSYFGYLFVPLGHGTIIQPSCAALGGLVLARLVLREPLPPRRIAGALAIVLGLCVIGAEALGTMGRSGFTGDLLFAAAGTSFAIADRADDGNGERVPYDTELAVDPDVLVYRITGAFFFGAAAAIGSVLDGIADKRKAFVVDFAAVPFLDSTAANAMGRVAAKARRQGIQLFITGASPAVRRALLTHGVSPPRARYRETIARAVADIKNKAAAAAADDLAAS